MADPNLHDPNLNTTGVDSSTGSAADVEAVMRGGLRVRR